MSPNARQKKHRLSKCISFTSRTAAGTAFALTNHMHTSCPILPTLGKRSLASQRSDRIGFEALPHSPTPTQPMLVLDHACFEMTQKGSRIKSPDLCLDLLIEESHTIRSFPNFSNLWWSATPIHFYPFCSISSKDHPFLLTVHYYHSFGTGCISVTPSNQQNLNFQITQNAFRFITSSSHRPIRLFGCGSWIISICCSLVRCRHLNHLSFSDQLSGLCTGLLLHLNDLLGSCSSFHAKGIPPICPSRI